jgi:hypothetical protein
MLRYSQRLALLQRATRMNIGRFEANLIIALVQHRSRGAASQAVQEPHTHATGRPARLRTLLLYGGTIAAVQGVVVLAALRLLGI